MAEQQTTALLGRIEDHVEAHMEHTEGKSTTIGAVAEALGVSCQAIKDAVDGAGEFGTWLYYTGLEGAPLAGYSIALDGE